MSGQVDSGASGAVDDDPFDVVFMPSDHRCALPTECGAGRWWNRCRTCRPDDTVIRCRDCGQHWRKGTPGFDHDWTRITDAQAGAA